jgi:murein peptide amidase A
VIVGRSVSGREIAAQSFGGGAACVLVFGAIHGDEPGAAEACVRFCDALAHDPPATRVIVVPIANPDGLARNRKNNDRDVDLNRNFDARNWRREHAAGYFPGDAPLSEPESRALAELIAVEKPRAVVSLHQPLRCVNWDGPADALAQKMSDACGYRLQPSIGYPTPGSFGSRYGVDENLPVVTLELPRPVPDGDWPGLLAALRCATMSGP